MKFNPKYLVPTPVRDLIRPMAKHYAYNHTYPRIYRQAAKEPVDERKVVFVDQISLQMPNSMQLVYDELVSRGYTCEFISLHMNSGKFSDYSGQSKKMAQMVATARLVVLSDVCVPLSVLPLRPQTRVVQLWHGCGAFKKFGMSTADKIFGSSREERTRYPAYRNTSLVTVSSPRVRWAYVEAMQMERTPDVVQATGVSRTDAFFDEARLAAWREEARAAVPAIEGRRVLLYAPTFRGRVSSAEAPDFLDVRALHERLGDEWCLLIKHHPFVRRRPAIPADCADFAFDVSADLSIEAAMVVSDACVSDYSSLVFEYSLLRRPMAFLAADIDEYDDWRGFYYDYDELTPGPVLTTTDQLADWVAGLETDCDLAEVDAFREKFMSACDGHATQRIVAAALEEPEKRS